MNHPNQNPWDVLIGRSGPQTMYQRPRGDFERTQQNHQAAAGGLWQNRQAQERQNDEVMMERNRRLGQCDRAAKIAGWRAAMDQFESINPGDYSKAFVQAVRQEWKDNPICPGAAELETWYTPEEWHRKHRH